ncbi:P-loop NTPase fold protein [Shewanella sp.]|uniref:P-loop NTPase fold protein n=1 Tax=Shewanella sp. TaxID=50422 RepID=UPI001EB211A0|nr:P-loop NTPase fold protein [Shewanella sp.]NRB24896.1 hypothetical protein [Shewanella sp.]
MSKSVTEQIIYNLNEDSFPSVQLLSGKWGCGKTYVAKNSIIPELQKKYANAHYVSLYGVSSLDDFRDKLVSLHYCDSKNSVENYSMLKDVIGNLAKICGDKGATLALANTLAKPMKHKLLSSMNNCAFIVDDLERASSKQLISEVLGECLNLVENNTNIAIVVLAHEDHIEDKSILEKTFNDKIVLTASPADIVKIIKQKYAPHLDEATSHSALNAIAALQLSNLRIVQRVMQRYVPIKYKIEQLPSVDITLALSRVIEQVFRICYAHYEYGASYDEMCRAMVVEQYGKILPVVKSGEVEATKNIDPAKLRLTDISKIVGYCTPDLVSYCLNITPIPSELVEAFNLPLEGKLLDRIKSFGIYDLSENQFEEAIKEAKEFLFDRGAEPKPFFDWFIVLNVYFFCIENMFIPENIDEEFVRAKAVVGDEEAFTPTSPERHYEMRLRDLHPFVAELYGAAKARNDKLSTNIRQSELQTQFLACWSTASTEIYRKYEAKPFLHQFDVDAVCQAFDGWKKRDIIEFGQFIENRYIVGHSELLQDEFEFVRQLKEHLETKISLMQISRLKGCLNLLIGSLDEGVKFIEKAESYNRD